MVLRNFHNIDLQACLTNTVHIYLNFSIPRNSRETNVVFE